MTPPKSITTSLRPPTEADLPFMREMLYEAVHWPPEKGEKPSREEIFSDPVMRRYLDGWGRAGDACRIALEGDERIGAAWCRLMPPDAPGYGFLAENVPELAVAVWPEHRGRGIGCALLEALIRATREAGYPALSLSVEKTNPAARLYERLGFVRHEERDTDYLMQLDL